MSTTGHLSPEEAGARLLDWYRAMGVDVAVEAGAIDWRGRAGPQAAAAWRRALGDEPGRASAAGGEQGGASPRVARGRTGERGGEHAGASSDGGAAGGVTGGAAGATAQPRAALPGRTLPEMKPAPRPSAAAQAPDAAVMSARAAAAEADTLARLGEIIDAFDGCGLKRTASKMCFYRGQERARLMIVGEAPGREEDLAGEPFVGPPGQLLDKMLTAAGIDPATTHIANMVYWRPPGNRTPTQEEIAICLPFLQRQIALVAPEMVLVLGAAAAKGLMGADEGIARVRGQWHEVTVPGVSGSAEGGKKMRMMATLHPMNLLRTPAAKRHAWRDVLAIRQTLDDAQSGDKLK